MSTQKEQKTTKKFGKIFKNIWKEVVIFLSSTCLIWFIACYFVLVSINLHSVGLWLTLFINLVVGFVIFAISNYIEEEYNYRSSEHSTFKRIIRNVFIILASLCVLFLIIGGIGSSKLLHAVEYADLIKVHTSSFEEDFDQVDINNLIIVDQKTAQKLGDRQLANFQNPSYYDVDDEYNLVKIGDEYVRISQVNYGDIFKSGAGSIPGYISVNAKNQDAKAIEFDKNMIYSPSAFWSKDLSRHIHSRYPSYILGKHFFEVDDEGNPYWITPVKEPTIFLFGGMLEKKILVTNAVSGDIMEYLPEEVPNWVDHVYSVDYLMELVEWHYSLRDGWWNAVFSKTNVFQTSYSYRSTKQDEDESEYTPFEGYNSIVDKDGNICFYTGITPANSAETNVGFVLINPRTGAVKYYDSTGAEESSAQKAAEGLVSNLKYSASFPTIVNVNGEETYFMLLKDGAGLVQRYAFCNVENYSKVVEASTVIEALKKYNAKINGQTYTETPTEATDENKELSDKELKKITGKVVVVEKAEIEGYTYYYFTLDGDDKVYMSSISNSNLQPMMLKEGIKVSVTFYDAVESNVEIVTEITFNK